MRPQRLEIEGIHSFRTRQTVDFAALSAGGLFGIFGDTGSGKSTVLDCIILALYGETPGRETAAQFIHLSSRTASVSLDFALGGKLYRVERGFRLNPVRAVSTATAKLIDLGTGAILCEQSKRVTAEVESLLGLGIEDFCKVVALPQGEFAEFLKATSGEQTKIAGRLFSLEQYGDDLIRNANRRAAERKAALESLEKELEAFADATPERISEEESRLAACRERVAALTIREKEKSAEVGKLRADAATTKKISDVVRELTDFAEEEKRRAEEAAQAERKVAASALFPKYEELCGLRKKKCEAEVARREAETSREIAEKDCAALARAAEDFEKTCAEAQKTGAARAQALRMLQKRETEAKELSDKLAATRADFRRAKETLAAALAEKAAAERKSAQVGAEILRAEARQRALAQEIAGVVNDAFLRELKGSFEEDCARAERRFPGVREDFSGTAAVIGGARTDDTLSKEYAELSETLRNLREEKSNADTAAVRRDADARAAEKAQKDLTDEGVRFKEGSDALEAELRSAGLKLFSQIPAALEGLEAEEKAREKELAARRSQAAGAQERLTAARTKAAAAEQDFENFSEWLARAEAEFAPKLAAFGTEKELAEVAALALSAEEILARAKDLKEKIRAAEVRRDTLLGALDRQVSETELRDAERALEDLRADLRGAQGEEIRCADGLDRLRKNAEKRKSLETEARRAKKRLDRVELICSAIRGKALMKFAVEEYLREICVSASAILAGVTGGSYRLVYENRDARECGFFVVDNRNGGERRAVCTLSGGETFLVSLSLAVSLSEALTAGGNNRAEFFFLDEGFGSLDARLCDVVLDALFKLKEDRFVIGLISHVEALKERIESRLFVTFDETAGSSVKI